MTITQAEIIRALAKNNLDTGVTAEELFMHRRTIQVNVQRVREATGLNPRNPDDLSELLRRATAVLEGDYDN